jgi:hypothetical protein
MEKLYMLSEKGFWKYAVWARFWTQPRILSRKIEENNGKFHIGYSGACPSSNRILPDLNSGLLPQHRPARFRIVVDNDDGRTDANPIILLVHFISGRFKWRVL